MKEILKLTLSVTFICALAGAALAFVSRKTHDRIEANEAAQRTVQMRLVLPPETAAAEKEEALGNAKVEFFAAKDAGGRLIGYCALSKTNDGFGGDLSVMAGLTTDGRITAILVSEHNETPGIGSRVCNRTATESLWGKLFGKSDTKAQDGLAPNAYLDSFGGRALPPDGFAFGASEASRSVTGVSGATFSSTAVLHAVNNICDAWKARKN